MKPTILIIDDDKAVRTSLKLLCKQGGMIVLSAESPEQGFEQASRHAPDLIVLDMNFSLNTSGKEGLQALKQFKQQFPKIPIILITAWGSIELAVEGMKQGASEFVTKPWSNDHLLQVIRTTLKLAIVEESSQQLTRRKIDETHQFSPIIGEDPQLLQVLETIGRVGATDASVLITGESGTGKELIAEAIHRNSERDNGPFVKVNLGGISSSLFESEMFGHKRGAFTDAKSDRVGRFELAHRGSIFLDEIGDLSLSSQVKLLRVLQDRTFEVLGTSQSKAVDVRVITATNRDLESMVRAGEFREDLFYRINLIVLKLPALRERPSDIPLLVTHFIAHLQSIYKRDQLTISDKALQWLSELPWPGNIRELKNVVERTVLITPGECLELDDFAKQLNMAPKRLNTDSLPAVGAATLEEMEKSMIEKALIFHKNNISSAANSLGLTRASLYRRMEKYGLSE